jgi:hypothetical protein
MFHFLRMILRLRCLIVERIVTINPPAFPKSPGPRSPMPRGSIRRTENRERKARTRVPRVTRTGIRTAISVITKKSARAFSTGLGSTASDGHQSLTTGH